MHAGTQEGAGNPGRGGLPAERRVGGLESVVHNLHYIVLGGCISQCSGETEPIGCMCVHAGIVTGNWLHNCGGWQVLRSSAGKPESRESQCVAPVRVQSQSPCA